MQSRRHTPESEDTGIDLAPMLDFTVNLLIFFIITTSFIKEAGVTVFKPSARDCVNRDSGNLLIAIRENGDIWMDRRRISCATFAHRWNGCTSSDRTIRVVIIADETSDAGVVAKVMDEVRLAGITMMSIAADPTGG